MKLPKELREKKELHGPTKSRNCSIKGCTEVAIRSISENKWGSYVETSRLKYEENRLRKIYLCKTHYKLVNKTRKTHEKSYQKKGFLENQQVIRRGKFFE